MGFNVPREEQERWVREGLVKPEQLAPSDQHMPQHKDRKVPLVQPLFAPPGTFVVPLHLEPVTNGGAMKREMIGRAGKHRRAVSRALAARLCYLVSFAAAAERGRAVACQIVHIARREMDDDNLKVTAKWVRDTVAMFLGVDDGPGGPVIWFYSQERGPACGVRITLEVLG